MASSLHGRPSARQPPPDSSLSRKGERGTKTAQMRIHPTDRVLEIGSGNRPRSRSDVLCDLFIDDDSERGGRIVADRPIVEADAQALPFADSSFDYVICSHVLEHVENPDAMLRELMRVASRGYIETPSEVAERLYGWPFHRSVIHLVDGKLLIRRKDFVSPFGELFHVLAARDPSFRRFHVTHNRLLLVQFEWEGLIEYEMAAEGSPSVDITSPEAVERLWRELEQTSRHEGWKAIAKSLLPRPLVGWAKSLLVHRRGGRVDLHRIVVCPQCKGTITWEEDRILCAACRFGYPIVRGIPRLILPDRRL